MRRNCRSGSQVPVRAISNYATLHPSPRERVVEGHRDLNGKTTRDLSAVVGNLVRREYRQAYIAQRPVLVERRRSVRGVSIMIARLSPSMADGLQRARQSRGGLGRDRGPVHDLGDPGGHRRIDADLVGRIHHGCACLRPKFEFATDSSLEGDGFELLVPRRRNSPRARHVVSAHGSTSSERH
jgi:hypothetical protein